MLSFASATGNLFNRLGKLGLTIKQSRTNLTAQLANLTDTVNGIVAQYNSESDIQAMAGDSYIGLLANDGGYGSLAQQMAISTVNRMVFRDNALLNQNLTQSSTLASLQEIIRQMRLAGASVLAQSIASTPGSWQGSSVGNAVLCTSVRRPLDGLVLENTFAETLTLLCTSDSYVGGSTAGNEGYQLTGQGNQSNLFAFNWPLGSNASAKLSGIDSQTDNGSGNILTNSDFETFSPANIPFNWTLALGTAGTNIFEEDSIVYDPTSGGKAVRIAGDAGGTLTTIKQQFGTTPGTAGTLSPLTQYGFNIWARRDGVAPANGTLTIDLVDSGNTTLLDAGGNANTFNIDLTALTTVYTAYNFAFRMPLVMPASYFLRIRLSGTPLTNGRSVYIDSASLGQMTQLATGEPFYSVHTGSIFPVQGDYLYVANTNSRGSGGTLSTWQTLLWLLFAEGQAAELLWPSSGTPTISDSLIA